MDLIEIFIDEHTQNYWFKHAIFTKVDFRLKFSAQEKT